MNKIFNLKHTTVTLLFMFTTGFCLSQKAEVKSQKVIIKTSTQCGMCKDKVEGVLNFTKGIVYADLDVPTQRLTVKFKPNKISFVELKNKIAAIGYDADDVKAKEEDVRKLPKCCQPGSHFKKN